MAIKTILICFIYFFWLKKKEWNQLTNASWTHKYTRLKRESAGIPGPYSYMEVKKDIDESSKLASAPTNLMKTRTRGNVIGANIGNSWGRKWGECNWTLEGDERVLRGEPMICANSKAGCSWIRLYRIYFELKNYPI